MYALMRHIAQIQPFKPLLGDPGGSGVHACCVCTRSRVRINLPAYPRKNKDRVCVPACAYGRVMRAYARACARVRVCALYVISFSLLRIRAY